MPKLSIIILTFNSSKFIKSCLDSIFSQDYQDFEVIIVDNGSVDNTLSWIKKNYPQSRLIENGKNLGAAKARNQAIEVAKSKWILTLDCDIFLEKYFLNKIMSFAEKSDLNIGSFQPKILRKNKKTIYSCGIYLSRLRRFYDIGKGKPDNGQFNHQKYIFGACSACAFYKREMLEEIKQDTGYFDERFSFLVEDVDLAWRARREGWKALYYPEAICYHLGNSSNTPKKIRQYLSFRNRYFLMSKNDRFGNIVKYFPLLMFYDMTRFFYLFFTNKYTLKALWQVIESIPRILEKQIRLYVKTDRDSKL